MNENMRAQDEISLAELFKALLRKIKVLVLALLIGVIVGASLGVVQTINVKYYGTKIDFYVNPKKDSTTTTENNSQYGVYGAYGLHVMDNMVTLLNSELFAERLTLNKDGLPLNGEDTFEEVDGIIVLKTKAPSLVNDSALNALIDEARTAILEAKNAQKAVEEAKKAIASAEKALTEAKQAFMAAKVKRNNTETNLTIAEKNRETFKIEVEALWKKFVDKGTPGETLPDKDINGQPILDVDKEKYKEASNKYSEFNTKCQELGLELEADNYTAMLKEGEQDAATLALQEVKKALTEKEELSIEAKAIAQEATAKAVEKWAEMPGYEEMVAANSECVSFSYHNENEKLEDLEDLARSFIYVTISVLNDKNLANDLYKKVIEIMPIFVEENMAIPSGYSGTKCRRITRDDGVKQTNIGYTVSTAVKYGLIAGVAFLAVACVAVILLDRSDKRLRNYEQTMSAFNVPVLGVIPTIEKDEEIDDTNDKKAGVQK